MRRLLRLPVVSAVALSLAGALAGCGTSTASDGGGGGKVTIGVSMAAPTIALYSGIQKGIKEEAGSRGVDVVFTDARGDAAKQADDINDLIARGVDGILVSGIDANALTAPLQAARAADIPVMTVARDVPDHSLRTSYVGNDWSRSGKMIADWTCRNVKTGKVAMIKGPGSAPYVQEMTKAYKAVVGHGSCSGLHIAYETNLDQLTAEAGLKATQDALSAVPDVKVIYANLDDFLRGVLQGIDEAGKTGKITVTGFDGIPETLEMVKSGQVAYEIALQPKNWGHTALTSMLDHLDGKQVADSIAIRVEPFTKANANELTTGDLE